MASFDIQNPGAKEYLIVGGVALIGGYLLIRWRSKNAAAAVPAAASPAPAMAGAGAAAPATTINQGTGFRSFLLDHQSSPQGSAATGTTSGTAQSPNVGHIRVDQAIAKIRAAGYQVGEVHLTAISGVRNESILPVSGYANHLVVMTQTNGNKVTIWAA